MDLMAVKLGAQMAKRELIESGQIGYIEKVPHRIFDNVTANCVPMEELGGVSAAMIEAPDISNVTDNYNKMKVVWDGDEYLCKYSGTDTVLIFGNAAMAYPEEENTGEPFCVIVDEEQGMSLVLSTEGEHTFTATWFEDKYHRPNEKFLPTIIVDGTYLFKIASSDVYLFINDICGKFLDDCVKKNIPFVKLKLTRTAGDIPDEMDTIFSKGKNIYWRNGSENIEHFYTSPICRWEGGREAYYVLRRHKGGNWWIEPTVIN